MLPYSVIEGLSPKFTKLKNVERIAVTTSSVVIDLSTRTNIWALLQAGRLLVMQASSTDVHYAFNSENGGSIDETNTTAGNATQCDTVPAGARLPGWVPYVSQADINASGGTVTTLGMCRYLIVKAPVATTLILTAASEAEAKRRGT